MHECASSSDEESIESDGENIRSKKYRKYPKKNRKNTNKKKPDDLVDRPDRGNHDTKSNHQAARNELSDRFKYYHRMSALRSRSMIDFSKKSVVSKLVQPNEDPKSRVSPILDLR